MLDDTYKSILTLSDKIEALMKILKKQTAILTCYAKFLVVLAGMKYNLSENDRRWVNNCNI